MSGSCHAIDTDFEPKIVLLTHFTMHKNAPFCDIKFKNFLGGDTPEPPYGPPVVRASGRPSAAARPIV